MGDKSPKSTRKRDSQKQARKNEKKKKKEAVEDAKRVVRVKK